MDLSDVGERGTEIYNLMVDFWQQDQTRKTVEEETILRKRFCSSGYSKKNIGIDHSEMSEEFLKVYYVSSVYPMSTFLRPEYSRIY